MSTDILNNFYGEIEDVDGSENSYVNSETTSTPNPDSLHHDAARALACCINTIGQVDLRWMEDNSGLSAAELTEALEGTIFQDPEEYALHPSEETGWVLRAKYISGNLEQKLSAAKRMDRKYKGRFSGNVLALKQALPEKVSLEEIGISIGSAWIPDYYYAQFAKELLGLKKTPEIFHSKDLGQWKVVTPDEAKKPFNNCYAYGYSWKSNGRSRCLTMLDILERTLNGKTIKITEEVSRPNRKTGKAYLLLKNETIAAQEKQVLLEKVFIEWLRKDPTRVKRLEQAFYDTFACVVTSKYDGSFLSLPDLNPAFVPYAHQRNAVARIVLEKDVLLNHAVGTGKTNIMIMGIHERHRMGLSRKNLIVVPNNVLEAFESAHRSLYPNDNILIIKPEDFSPDGRQKMLEKIRDEDFVAIYMAFSSFKMIEMSRDFRLAQKAEEIRCHREKLAKASSDWEKFFNSLKIDVLTKELEKMRTNLPPDKYLPFDQLGITTLAVDEAHFYKNVTIHTGITGVVGLHTKGSEKSNSLLEKAQFVRSHGGSLLFSTGTPITNSIADLFVLQLFLQPEQLRFFNISHFDEWIGTFASRKPGFEVDVDSQSYRIRTRFSSFFNLPELTAFFAEVCDFYNGEEISGLPECGDYIDTVIPKSPEQAAYIEEIVLRTEMIRAGLVPPTEDNLLKVTTDGRSAALDIRLVDQKALPDPGQTKVFSCALNVFKCWKNHPGTAQLVFCDLGTPKKEFNIYDELKDQLIRMGIPDTQIAFVHDAVTDAKRRKLFKAVNKADIRVLIGSTSKLGTGVNVQENLIAIHHLDVPWKPSDITQREGRMIRQGNNNSHVFRFRYITSGTFDSYSWQILENKQRFIGQFMAGRLSGRDAGDIDDTVLSYAEIKALCVGDPLLRNRIETGNELERVKIHSRQRERELRNAEKAISINPLRIERLEERRDRLIQDQKYFEENRESLTKQERTGFGEDLLYALRGNLNREEERRFDTLHGFDVILPAGMKAEKPWVMLRGASGNDYDVNMLDAKESGCIQRIEYVLLHLDARVRTAEGAIETAKQETEQAKKVLEQGNPYAAQVSRLNHSLLEIDIELKRRAEENIA